MKYSRLILNILVTLGIVTATLILTTYVFVKGLENGNEYHAWNLFWGYIFIFGTGGIILLYHETTNETACHKAVKDMKKRIDDMADKLKANGQNYTRKYKEELKQTPTDKAYGLHHVYKTKYLALRQIYAIQIDQLLEQEWTPASKPFRLRDWGWKLFIMLAVVSLFVSCGYTMGTGSKMLADDTTAKADRSIRAWTAKDVSLPHLKDSTCYVFNPENVVSENTVSLLNRQLQQMDHELGVESAVFIVHHVKDKDIFRFAQDIFDLYKIGRNDRGLVMVLALDDHLYRTHTGYALESELTDAEAHQLEARYLVPYMKANLPDSAMIYLTTAFYKTLQNNGIPPASSSSTTVSDNKANEEDTLLDLLFYYFIIGLLCGGTYAGVSDYRGWHLRIYARNRRRTNIFKSERSFLPIFFGGGGISFFSGGGGGSYSSGGSSRSSSSWGGGGGGSYGGGGSGGGGSTSSW